MLNVIAKRVSECIESNVESTCSQKKENKSLVLETIKEKAPISRASIAQITGLNKGTVSSLVGELIDEKLINESGTGESSGGRRPVMLLLNETAGFTIAVDLGVKSMLGVLTDLRGAYCSREACQVLR